MNIKEDFDRFSERFGRPVDQWKEFDYLTKSTLDLGQQLFRGSKMDVTTDGHVVVSVDNGRNIALICVQNEDLGAFATRFGSTYFIALNTGLIQLIFTLSSTVCKNQRFLSQVQSCIRNTKLLEHEAIPPGFESLFVRDVSILLGEWLSYNLVAAEVRNAEELPNEANQQVIIAKIEDSYHFRIFDQTGKVAIDYAVPSSSMSKPFKVRAEDAINRKKNILDSFEKYALLKEIVFATKEVDIRDSLFFLCFKRALTFFWLHETAHILDGHIDTFIHEQHSIGALDEFLHVAEPDVEGDLGSIPYHAIEIIADRWALQKVFGKVHQHILSNPLSDIELLATTVGCTLFHLSFYGYNQMRGRSDIAFRHPPLWFRADQILRYEAFAAQDQWFNNLPGNTKYDEIRLAQQNLVQLTLAGMSSLHPVFAEWLDPVAESVREAEAQRVLNEALMLYEPWRETITKNRCFFELE